MEMAQSGKIKRGLIEQQKEKETDRCSRSEKKWIWISHVLQ